ncbi:hypothetical protein K788_0006124 (plasmid) [Paraburkholderia caribensis MBA4]|uniref:Uncharacterized protein n=1 Tax=Paraburkholderia caribensis MBA4 TaxID=1323664 RepID=A0A0N7JWA5_9BURK|nr:hypothetical protein K788_0006124 [Paraburkholderia caribensis MBA4]
MNRDIAFWTMHVNTHMTAPSAAVASESGKADSGRRHMRQPSLDHRPQTVHDVAPAV